jgi:hypothetical protein
MSADVDASTPPVLIGPCGFSPIAVVTASSPGPTKSPCTSQQPGKSSAPRLILAVAGYVIQVTAEVDYPVPSAEGEPRGCQRGGNLSNRGDLSRDPRPSSRARGEHEAPRKRLSPASSPKSSPSSGVGGWRVSLQSRSFWPDRFRADARSGRISAPSACHHHCASAAFTLSVYAHSQDDALKAAARSFERVDANS